VGDAAKGAMFIAIHGDEVAHHRLNTGPAGLLQGALLIGQREDCLARRIDEAV